MLLVGAGRVVAAGHRPALLSVREAADAVGADGARAEAVVAAGRAEADGGAGRGADASGAAGGVAEADGAEYLFLGEADGVSYVARVLPEASDDDGAGLPGGLGWIALRDLADSGDPLTTGLAVEAVALANWHAVTTHCPRCGKPTEPAQAGWVRRCPGEDIEHYPRTDPAVIMSIVDDAGRLLLGRAPTWPAGRMSVLAGFVEPGESAEQAVVREAAEETGVVVGQVEYRGSQSWPMPCSLMLGFHARAETTRLTPDTEELAEARWFTREELRAACADGTLSLPGHASIARALIESWLSSSAPPTPGDEMAQAT
ncbi:hypothetical protein GCM10009751_05440 [Myceligenerans crystallogenes]|uniref:NAD(+) diphosphatase n=1 Tax=Myceligenerans crystallogenes TaxID=316335 RepID=A0ABN2N578_9MICO